MPVKSGIGPCRLLLDKYLLNNVLKPMLTRKKLQWDENYTTLGNKFVCLSLFFSTYSAFILVRFLRPGGTDPFKKFQSRRLFQNEYLLQK